MANFSIRKFDDGVYEHLKIRAAKHGVSMEEEARQILYQAVVLPEKISTVFMNNFGAKYGIDLDLSDHQKPHEPIDFSE